MVAAGGATAPLAGRAQAVIEVGPLHLTWALLLWLIAAGHGVWSRHRIYRADLAQLRYNRANRINGAMELYGVRAVTESARATFMYLFAAFLGLAGSFIEPARADPTTGSVLISWGLVALLWGFSFSDYLVRAVARRLRREPLDGAA